MSGQSDFAEIDDPMKLRQHSIFLSIVEFPDTELPDFTLITGLNGAGKSHLLKAISLGHIQADTAEDHRSDVRYYDWATMVPSQQSPIESRQIEEQRFSQWNSLHGHQVKFLRELANQARQLGFTGDHLAEPKRLCSVTREECQSLFGTIGDTIHERLSGLRSAIANKLRAQLIGKKNRPHWSNGFYEHDPLLLLTMDESEFLARLPLGWEAIDPFQQSLGRLFVAYRGKQRENILLRYMHEKGDAHALPLTDDEFDKSFGIPPWDYINAIVQSTGLGFKIDNPPLSRDVQYVPRLTKLNNGAAIQFDELSSGEKVLMSFALCAYTTQDRLQLSQPPSLVLFDEIDAPLHPSMTDHLLRAINETFIGKNRMRVIMTTHSPSTVALAPESAIHVMRNDRPGIHKVSKYEALSLLTCGVPTLAISHEGRRHVFVESKHDEALYSDLYDILKPTLASARSLTFIAAGHSEDGGCDRVRALVQQLRAAKNNSIFGVVDWDCTNSEGESVFVLSAKKRYALENVLLDPLIVAAMVIRDARQHCDQLGWDKNRGHALLCDESNATLQSLVDKVQVAMEFDSNGPRSENQYKGGFRLSVLDEYNHFKGHDLEERVLNCFQPLKSFVKYDGGIKRHVVQAVLRDVPGIIPHDVVDLFNNLLNC